MTNIVQARVVRLHWEEGPTASQEATLEVEHPDGTQQFFVIPILRMSDKIPAVKNEEDE